MEILPITRVRAQAGGGARAASPGAAGTDSAPRHLPRAGETDLGHGAWRASCTPQQASGSASPQGRGAVREAMP